MIDLSNNSASLHVSIPSNRFFDLDTQDKYPDMEVTWLMSIKPGIRNVEKVVEGKVRIEEIQVFSIEVFQQPDSINHMGLLRQLYTKVKYPCVVFLVCGERFKISAWKFRAGVRDSDKNVLYSYYETSWMHDPAASKKTELCIKNIKELLLTGEGSLEKLYDDICKNILTCQPQYLGSKARLLRVLKRVQVGESGPKHIPTTMVYIARKPNGRYGPRELTNQYHYYYDYEDVWYYIMNNPKAKERIEYLRDSDMDELVFRAEESYYDHRR